MTGAFVMGAAGQSTSATLFDGGAGADTFIGNSGDDVFKAGGGATNSMTGGLVTILTRLAVELIQSFKLQTVLAPASATTITASAAIAIGHTITFGNGVDTVTGFQQVSVAT